MRDVVIALTRMAALTVFCAAVGYGVSFAQNIEFQTTPTPYYHEDGRISAGTTIAQSDTAITIYDNRDNKQVLVVEIKQNGSVKFGDGYTADEAARRFWYVLGTAFGDLCRKQ